MRILQIISSLKIGGAQKLQVTLGAAARACPVTWEVLSLHHDTEAPIRTELQALGLRTHHMPGASLFDMGRFQRLLQFLRAERFDIIQSHLTYANILAVLAGQLTGTPVVGTLHNVKIEPKHYQAWREGFLEPMALKYGARRVIAVGQMVAEAYRQRLGGNKLVVIPNAVAPLPSLNNAERLTLRQTFMPDPARPLLLAVGRLSIQKGFADLLEAFARVRQTHPHAFLAIVGSGELHPDLTAQLERLGLVGHALLLGARTDVPRLMAASDLFVSASLWEGLPVALLEAMSVGLPVVVTAVGEVPQVVVDGVGVLTPPQAPAQLAEALSALLDDAPRRMALGLAAQMHVARHYSPQAWFNKHLAVYNAVLQHPVSTEIGSAG